MPFLSPPPLLQNRAGHGSNHCPPHGRVAGVRRRDEVRADGGAQDWGRVLRVHGGVCRAQAWMASSTRKAVAHQSSSQKCAPSGNGKPAPLVLLLMFPALLSGLRNKLKGSCADIWPSEANTQPCHCPRRAVFCCGAPPRTS